MDWRDFGGKEVTDAAAGKIKIVQVVG